MPGIGISIVLIAVGAILEFAVTVNPDQHGFNINAVGLILLIVGLVGFVVSLLFWTGRGGGWYGPRRHRTTIDDGSGRVVRREDQYL
jgi:hypothetical protein